MGCYTLSFAMLLVQVPHHFLVWSCGLAATVIIVLDVHEFRGGDGTMASRIVVVEVASLKVVMLQL